MTVFAAARRSAPAWGVLFLAIPLRAADVRPLLLDAQKQYADGRYEQALKLYRQAADAAGGDAAIDYNSGLCHLRLGDGDKAIQQFEAVASRAEAPPSLRRDAFYNLGVVRVTATRQRLEALLAPATQPTDRKPAPDDPANIEALQTIAAEFLRGIAAFKNSEQIEPSPDTAHNIRAARILRRNVLGLLKKAVEARARKDMLDDPRAFLEALALEQNRQAGLSRFLIIRPPEDPGAARQARRAAIRLQRQTLEQTGTFADHLEQFREQAPTTQPAGTQPAADTPREKLYRAAAGALKPAMTAMKDACAFFLDGRTDSAHAQQRAALDAIRTAIAMFPVEPDRALAQLRIRQAELTKLVSGITAPEHWLRDPLVGQADPPPGAAWEPKNTALYDGQHQIGEDLARLAAQCRHVATASRPVGSEGPGGPPPPPAMDRELNTRLADLLEPAAAPQAECLRAIVDRRKDAVLAAQKRIAEIIDAALDLFPKSIEQRLAELIVRQARLNGEVRSEAGEAPANAKDAAGAILDKVRELTAKLKSAILRSRPADVAGRFAEQQRDIRQETAAVGTEIRKKIPTAGSQPSGAPPSGREQEAQAYIEAGKHVEKADFEMLAAAEGLDRAVVENSLRPLRADGPVQRPQATALEELRKALAALRPPESQPQQQDQDQKKDDRQQQRQPERQDVRRAVEQQENEREKAMRELYKVRPREVLKDW